jgi:hypothetical protein
MGVHEALVGYGYIKTEDGWYVRHLKNDPALALHLTDFWKEEGVGEWVCLSPAVPDINGGPPWGQANDRFPGMVLKPYKQILVSANGEASHPSTTPTHYQWMWPADYVAFIYEHANDEMPSDG